MRKVIKYISENGYSFDTPELAIEDDKRLISIIATYQADLDRMNSDGTFAGKPATPEIVKMWERAVEEYKQKYEAAQASWAEFEKPVVNTFEDWEKAIDEKLAATSDEELAKLFEPKIQLSRCEGCSSPINIADGNGQHANCNFVYGRRGWRQLGAYDG